ncbi:DUF6252 family protein [uncultured Winogradskyella sp.]|uniref:DUF6252 family protein n=1 Tax=uncultured Winogradskyella sp. TaxID=395353 RepID=UPI002638EFFB|nr:DUF6252 family protein [uncultured Winogradskyella sp.]
MKKTIYILSLIIITLYSCSSDDNDNNAFDGTGGIKCKVDGKLIESVITFGGIITLADVRFTSGNNEEYLIVELTDSGEFPDFIRQSVSMTIIDMVPESVQVGDIYILDNEQNSNYGKYEELLAGTFYNYSTNDENVGELEIVFHDLENRILAGTFEYNAINENGVIVEIREGEFDMQY